MSQAMSQARTKDRLLATIRDEREQWRGLVGEVGEEWMERSGPMGEWTFKDLAAHLTGWRPAPVGSHRRRGRPA